MNNEKAIQTASKLYEARRASKLILGDKWKPQMDMLAGHIRTVMGARKVNEVQAAMLICDEVKKNGGPPNDIVHILSAAVEMVEPSTP